MYELDLKGMPSILKGEKAVLPFPLIEIMRTPFGIRVDADDFYREGGEIGRWLLSKTPFLHTKKYTLVYLQFHYLEGNYSHVPTSDWHCDGSYVPFLADDIFHTMVCLGDGIDGQLKTEFLKEDKKIIIPDHIDPMKFTHETFRAWITDNAESFNLESVEAESGRMYTWTSRHLHRVQFAKSPHFRLFWKAVESDHLTPSDKDRGFRKATYSNSGADVRRLDKVNFNLEQGDRGIIIRGMRIGG